METVSKAKKGENKSPVTETADKTAELMAADAGTVPCYTMAIFARLGENGSIVLLLEQINSVGEECDSSSDRQSRQLPFWALTALDH